MRTLIFGLTIFLSGCAGGMQNTYNLPYSDSNYLDSFQAERKEVKINLTEELKKPFTNGDTKTSYRAAPYVDESPRMQNPYLDNPYLQPLPGERKEVTINSIDELNKVFKFDGNPGVRYRIAPGVLEENLNKLAPFNIR